MPADTPSAATHHMTAAVTRTSHRMAPAMMLGPVIGIAGFWTGGLTIIVAIIVVKGFLAVVTRFGFGPFAWYRIVAGIAALIWLSAR